MNSSPAETSRLPSQIRVARRDSSSGAITPDSSPLSRRSGGGEDRLRSGSEMLR
jgi:hypothetical protein